MSDSLFEMPFPAVGGRTVVSRFDGGEITSDSGLLLLSQADRKLQLTQRLATQIVDKRESGKVRREIADLLRERIFAIAAGYEDANDLDHLCLCRDPALLLSCGKPLGEKLASQPTMSRFENGASVKDLFCLAETMAWVVIERLPANTHSAVTLRIKVTGSVFRGLVFGLK